MYRNKIRGHLLCLLCVAIWGSALLSAKILTKEFSAMEMVFWRFLLGYAVLWILYPHPCRFRGSWEEMACAACGFTGVTLYFFCQNEALFFTSASNISVIVSTASMFTALCAWAAGGEKPGRMVRAGFLVAVAGIVLIVFDGLSFGAGSIRGDLLAAAAAFSWGIYSVVIHRLDVYPALAVTRKTFFYGILESVPFLLLTHRPFNPAKLADPAILLPMAFMGCLASAICYAIWGVSFRLLGAVRTNLYLYTLPVSTLIFEVLFFHKNVSAVQLSGVAVTILGLTLSQINHLRLTAVVPAGREDNL